MSRPTLSGLKLFHSHVSVSKLTDEVKNSAGTAALATRSASTVDLKPMGGRKKPRPARTPARSARQALRSMEAAQPEPRTTGSVSFFSHLGKSPYAPHCNRHTPTVRTLRFFPNTRSGRIEIVKDAIIFIRAPISCTRHRRVLATQSTSNRCKCTRRSARMTFRLRIAWQKRAVRQGVRKSSRREGQKRSEKLIFSEKQCVSTLKHIRSY